MSKRFLKGIKGIVAAAGVGLLVGILGGILFGGIIGGIMALIPVVAGRSVGGIPSGIDWDGPGGGALCSSSIGAFAGPIAGVIGWLSRSRVAGAIGGFVVGGVAAAWVLDPYPFLKEPEMIELVMMYSGGAAAAGMSGVVAGAVRCHRTQKAPSSFPLRQFPASLLRSAKDGMG